MLEATLQGNLGGEPTLKQWSNDRQVLNFSVGCYTGKDRETQKAKTTWVRVAVWGAMAERLAYVLHKGSGVLCRGRIEIREYTDQSTGALRQSLDMVANTCLPVKTDWGEKPASGQSAAPARAQASARRRPAAQPTPPPPSAEDENFDEVPF